MAFESADAKKTVWVSNQTACIFIITSRSRRPHGFQFIITSAPPATVYWPLTISRPHLGRHIRPSPQWQLPHIKVLHLLRRPARGLQRRVHRPGADGIHPDPLGGELHCERAGERDDGALGGRVVDHGGRALEGGDGRGVDDAAAASEVGEGVFGEGKHGEDVGAEGGFNVGHLCVSAFL